MILGDKQNVDTGIANFIFLISIILDCIRVGM